MCASSIVRMKAPFALFISGPVVAEVLQGGAGQQGSQQILFYILSYPVGTVHREAEVPERETDHSPTSTREC
jgi:hypothetical protein